MLGERARGVVAAHAALTQPHADASEQLRRIARNDVRIFL